MRVWPRAIHCVVCVMFLAGCAGGPRAPRTSAGEPVEIVVLCDNTCPADLADRAEEQFVQFTRWMERDLTGTLTRSGYKAAAIRARDEFEPRAGRYLLTTKNVRYNPGSRTARALIGFGAGFASVDVHYEFYGVEPQALMVWDDGASTSFASLRGIAQKLNQRAVERITDTLASSRAQ